MQIPLLGPPFSMRYRSHSARQLKNYFLVRGNVDEEYPFLAYPTPGASLFCELAGSSVRAAYEWRGTGYVVVGDKFYAISKTGVATLKGRLNTTTGRVSIATIEGANGGQMMLVDGVNGWLYAIGLDVFVQITDLDFPNGCQVVTAFDERFIVPVPNSSNWQISDVADGTTWQALQTASKRSRDDLLMAPVYNNLYIWLFGEESAEAWVNTGNEDFTFERQSGLALSFGLVAKHAVTEAGNQLFWLGRAAQGSPVIFSSNGFQPMIISSEDLNYRLGTVDDLTDAFAYSMVTDGHEWVVFTFPSLNYTGVYDLTTQAWFQWSSLNTKTLEFGRHFSNCHMLLGGKHIVGDSVSGNLYELDFDVMTDRGNRIERVIQSDNMDFDGRLHKINNLQIEVETGVGLLSGQGSDPKMWLEISKDGANTWSNPIMRSPGARGHYTDRIYFPAMGTARRATYRLTVTDPVKWVIRGARADIVPTKR